MPSRGLALLAALLLVCVHAGAAAPAAGKTRALLVAGIGGIDKYDEEFERDVNLLATGMRGVADDVVVLVGAQTEDVDTALRGFAERTRATDNFIFGYVGHGSFDGEQFRFNVAGRDFTGSQLGDWLERVHAKHQLVMVMSSSSGALLELLARDGRTLISATRSGDQRNATVFARYFARALAEDAADVNKDRRVSASEAFDYAKARVEGFYAEKNQMATEHPQLEGTKPVIVLAEIGSTRTSPEVAHLVARRESLELDIEQLKTRKDELSSAAYFEQLQNLLLDLALVESEIEADEIARDGGGASP